MKTIAYKTLAYKTLAIISILALGSSFAGAQDQKAQFAACLDTGFAKLIEAKSKDFTSPQYRVVCQHRDINRRERNESFTYEAPDDFQIGQARFNVVVKSVRTSIGDLVSGRTHATISLRCHGDPDHELNHFGVGGNIVGSLVYQSTIEDAKNIARFCFDKVLR